MKEFSVRTFGDSRSIILETMLAVRSGQMKPEQGMTVAALMKVLNDNIQVEINAAKVSMLAKEKGHDFGLVCKMGTKMIGNE